MNAVALFSGANRWMIDPFMHHYYKHVPDTNIYACVNPTKDWIGGASRFIDSLHVDYFLLMLDDYWVQKVNMETYFLAMQMMEDNRDIMKIDLSGDRARFPCVDEGQFFVESAQDAPYRTSLQAAFWRTSYFLNFRYCGASAWDFEIQGSKKAKNDGARILGVKRNCLKYINVLRRGEWYGKYDF